MVYWLISIVTLTQPRVSWEEKISIEKMLRLEWPMAISVTG